MKRVAICMSGFIRAFEYSKLNFQSRFLCNDDMLVDVFVHTYYENYFEQSSNMCDIQYDDVKLSVMFAGMNVRVMVVERRSDVMPLLETENAKYQSCENNKCIFNESSDDNAKQVQLGIRIIDQLRKIELCNELKKEYERQNGFTYDYVVKTRFEMLCLSSINWSLVKEGVLWTEVGATLGYPHDLILIGTSSDMDKCSLRYSHLSELCNIYNSKLCSHDTLRCIVDKYQLRLDVGIVKAVALRSGDSFHKLYVGTTEINKIGNERECFELLRNMYPRKLYIMDIDLIQPRIDLNNVDNICIITSVINISSAPTYGHSNRSVYSALERLEQTVMTLKSVRAKIPNVRVILVEATIIPPSYIHKLEPYLDYILLCGYSETTKYYCSEQPNKSLGECYLLASVLSMFNSSDNIKRIFKLSGRYVLNDDFDDCVFDCCVYDSMYGQICRDECVLTVLFCLPYSMLKEFIELLLNFIRDSKYAYSDIEHYLFDEIKKITHVPIIGVEGKVAVEYETRKW